jgi:hypothetical protein
VFAAVGDEFGSISEALEQVAVDVHMCCHRRWRWRVHVGAVGMGLECVGWSGAGAGAVLTSGSDEQVSKNYDNEDLPFGEKNRRPFHIETLKHINKSAIR